jgi:hypothetical protein
MGCAADDDTLDIAVEAPSIGLLKFNLSNRGKERITIKSWQTPWTHSVPYPLALSVHVLDSETNRPTVSEQAGMHANEIIDDIEIEPDSSLVGEVNIESRFHDDEGNEALSRYVVHWTYSLPVCELGKTFLSIGIAERNGEAFEIIFQDTLVTAAPPRCDQELR